MYLVTWTTGMQFFLAHNNHHLMHFISFQVKLSDYIGKKYVILFFYPLDFTFVCPTGLLHIATYCLLN